MFILFPLRSNYFTLMFSLQSLLEWKAVMEAFYGNTALGELDVTIRLRAKLSSLASELEERTQRFQGAASVKRFLRQLPSTEGNSEWE